MLKKILTSKWVKLGVSLLLIYLAFRKVDILLLLKQLAGVDVWFVISNVLMSFVLVGFVSYRLSLLLIRRPKFKDVMIFIKSSFAASFYGLFLPTAAAGDILKWIIIDDKYPEIPKTKLLGSVLLDRFIGMSVFVLTGSLMLILARINGVVIPIIIELLFWGLLLGCSLFYVFLIFGKINVIWKIKWLKKFECISELLDKDNIGQIFKGVLVSVVSELFWILQMWFTSWYFGSGLSAMAIFIYLPVISMILILPISIAGFGAREQLYLFFFAGLARSPESLLLTSTFSGILGIINSLFGGLITLTPDFKESINRSGVKEIKK